MPRYQITCRCTRCGHKWKRITSKPDSADPPCPNLSCGETPVPIGMDFSSNKAPAQIGQNVFVKARDEAYQIAAEDYGLTDIRDDVHRGEIAAPKLAPHLQKQADNFFTRPKVVTSNGQSANLPRFTTGMLNKFVDPKAPDVMGAIHREQWRPPVYIVNQRPPQ